MNKYSKIQKSILALIILVIASLKSIAAEMPVAASTGNSMSPQNIALYVLGGVIILFVIIIYVLSSAVKIAGKSFIEKIKKHDGTKVLSILLFLSLLSLSVFAQDVEKAAPVPYSFDSWNLYLLLGVVFLLFIVVLVLVRTLFILMGIKQRESAYSMDGSKAKVKTFFQRFNETVPIEEEASLDMSHDYDGIRELDNKIPSWWTWAMAGLVLFAIVYLYRMFIAETLPNQYQELAEANEIAQVQKDEYLKKGANNVDENTVKILGASDIAEGAALYAKNCLACHGDKGQGGVGPNFTDEYWIHKGGIKDIFYSIKYGWQEKGMKSWKEDFNPMQIAQLANFVKSLKGTNPPGGKEKQGELYTEESITSPKTDSAKAMVISDSIKTKK